MLLNSYQWGLYTVMKCLLLAILISILTLSGCTTSDVIMTGSAKVATSPSEISFYLRPPKQFESIGLVTAVSNSTPLLSSNKNSALKELKKKASSVGANGLILMNESTLGAQVELKAEAIWVEK